MSDPTLPLIDEVYVKRIFEDLEAMDVPLDADPIMFGPKRLNTKVAACRQHLSRCQQIFLQVSHDLHQLKRALRQAKVDFDLQMQDLFANDPEVRSGRNVRDREAIATMKLRTEREAIQHIESAVQDLETVITVVKGRREDLKDVQGRIRDQLKLCQEERDLGVSWGSALPPGQRPVDLVNHPKINPASLTAMHEVIGPMEGEASISDLDLFVQQELASRGEVPEPPLLVEEPVELQEAVEDDVTPPPPDEYLPDDVLPVLVDDVLPDVVAMVSPAQQGTTRQDEIDDFFAELQLDSSSAPTSTTPPTPPVTDDLDIEDLIGTFT